jgi:GDP-mannose 6-dehydrogenase
MIKYACNAFHAVKISFANEIGALAGQLGVNPFEVMETLCADDSLNISKAYLKPGFAFGGSCLPKDLRALSYRANRMDLSLPMLDNVLESNQAHLQRAIDAVLDLPAERIGIFGLAFKENTDDLRESAVVTMLEQLIGKGRNLKVYDPYIKLDLIYGTNQQYIMRAIPHIGRLMEQSFESMAKWADYLVIAQKPSAEFAGAIEKTGLPVIDLVGAMPEHYSATGRKRLEAVP